MNTINLVCIRAAANYAKAQDYDSGLNRRYGGGRVLEPKTVFRFRYSDLRATKRGTWRLNRLTNKSCRGFEVERADYLRRRLVDANCLVWPLADFQGKAFLSPAMLRQMLARQKQVSPWWDGKCTREFNAHHRLEGNKEAGR